MNMKYWFVRFIHNGNCVYEAQDIEGRTQEEAVKNAIALIGNLFGQTEEYLTELCTIHTKCVATIAE
jgi:hypothetical protein